MSEIAKAPSFINAWIEGRNTCVADLIEQATDGDELATRTLRSLSGDPPATSEEDVLYIGCGRERCSGGVRLLMENAGIEVVNCDIQTKAALPHSMPR